MQHIYSGHSDSERKLLKPLRRIKPWPAAQLLTNLLTLQLSNFQASAFNRILTFGILSYALT
jgi:hypothetical protein